MRRPLSTLYYGFAQHFPTQPMPGWNIWLAFRRFLVARIYRACGTGVKVSSMPTSGMDPHCRWKSRANRNEFENWSRCIIGDDVVMGPMWSS